jgi:hypothetical protein
MDMIKFLYAGKTVGCQYPFELILESFSLMRQANKQSTLKVFTQQSDAKIFEAKKHPIDWLSVSSYISKGQLLNEIGAADALIIVLGVQKEAFNMIMPSKFYELVIKRKPIFVLAPISSELYLASKKIGWIHVCSEFSIDKITKSLLNFVENYESLKIVAKSGALNDVLSRKKIAVSFDEVLKN